MIYVCLWSPLWTAAGDSLTELAASLLEVTPRVVVDADRSQIWADALGLPVPETAQALVDIAARAALQPTQNSKLKTQNSIEVHAGVSAIPIAAELAARAQDPEVNGQSSPLIQNARFKIHNRIAIVPTGRERDYIAPVSLSLLTSDARLLAMLDGVGVRTCGELAALTRDEVDVRLGTPAGALWRLARAVDRRILFRPIPRERPRASMDFIDYEVREATRLVFTVNALLGNVCGVLDSRGERARSITLTLEHPDSTPTRERLRAARPTADRDFWIRRLQGLLDRLQLPEPVTGLAIEVDETEPRSSTQGDLFDRGFATAGAVEEAVARLLDEQGRIFVRPERSAHTVAERRTRWLPRPATDAARPASSAIQNSELRIQNSIEGAALDGPALSLQLLPRPRPIGVRVAFRGVQILPAEFLSGREWKEIALAVGPDRISGGRWEPEGWAREYFRCVTADGALIWIYRDLAENRWYLHGWWD